MLDVRGDPFVLSLVQQDAIAGSYVYVFGVAVTGPRLRNYWYHMPDHPWNRALGSRMKASDYALYNFALRIQPPIDGKGMAIAKSASRPELNKIWLRRLIGLLEPSSWLYRVSF